MKRLAGVGIALCCVALVGCFDLEEELRINADGSGSAKARIEIIPQAVEALAGVGQIPGATTTGFPVSLDEQDMQAWFERSGIEVADLTVQDRPDGGKVATVALLFDDVRELASTDLTRFSMAAGEGDAIVYRAPFLASPPPEGASFPTSPERSPLEFAMTKLIFRGAHGACTVTLPGAIVETNGALTEPRTAVWDWRIDDMGFETFRAGMQAVFHRDEIAFELPVGKVGELASRFGHVQVARIEIAETEAPMGVEVAVNSVRLMRDLRPATGSERGDLTVTLSVKSNGSPRPVAVREVVLHTAVTDTDEVLTLESSGGYVNPAFSVAGRPIIFDLQPYLSLSLPDAESSNLEVLEGELTLIFAEGTQPVRVAPMNEWIGKRIEHPELGGLDVHLSSIERPWVNILLGERANELIQEVRFETAGGRPLQYYGWSWSSDPGGFTRRTYDLEADPEGAIVFEVCQNPKTCKVPFSFRDVPLP